MPKHKVLAVDDDPSILKLITASLGSIEYQIEKAFDGEHALKKVSEFKPDVILLDVMMPKLNGFEVCRELKSRVFTRYTPVIILSARQELEDQITGLEIGADDYITKPFNPLELKARIDNVLRRSHEHLDANPITRLPGNVSIEHEIVQRIKSGNKFAFCYVDLDNFKAYNDKYGFYQGDQIIFLIAQILVEAVREGGNPTDFVGHVGGDDFVFITRPDRVKSICEAIINVFDQRVLGYYNDEDRERGYIISKNRQGLVMAFPIMSISIVAITNEHREINHPAQISTTEGELKAYAKSLKGSNYVIDKRKNDPVEKKYYDNLKVLILDAELEHAQQQKLRLESEGYMVTIASNSQEALKLLADEQLNAILIEKKAPFLDAFELCNLVKTNPEYQHIPVLIMADVEKMEYDSNVDHIEYFTKKIKIDDLIQKIHSVLE